MLKLLFVPYQQYNIFNQGRAALAAPRIQGLFHHDDGS